MKSPILNTAALAVLSFMICATPYNQCQASGIHRNVAMCIMGHAPGADMNRWYDNVEEIDLIAAVDKLEVYLKGVRQFVRQKAVKR